MSKKKEVRWDEVQEDEVKNKDPTKLVELKHFLFLGGTGTLSVEQIREHFSRYGRVINVETIAGTGKWAIVCFEKSQIVRELIEKHWEQVDNWKMEMKTFKADSSVHFGKVKIKDDKNLQEVEKGHSFSGKKTVKIIEHRQQLPKLFLPAADYKWILCIRNEGPMDEVLLHVESLIKQKEFSMEDTRKRGESTVILKPGKEHKLQIHFKSNEFNCGVHRQQLVIRFHSHQIAYTVEVNVGIEEDILSLLPKEELKKEEKDDNKRILVPVLPTNKNVPLDIQWINKLPEYLLPMEIQENCDNDMLELSPWLTRENYRERLHLLLYLEEAQQQKIIRKYDLCTAFDFIGTVELEGQQKVVLTRLHIDEMFGSNLPLVSSDSICTWVQGSSDYEYEGRIYGIEKNSLLVVFCDKFKEFLPNTKFNIKFSYSRTIMRLMHRALDVVKLDLLWPKQIGDYNKSHVKIEPFDSALNKEQLLAVRCIVGKNHGNIPFLLFGARGTGKSRTLVEAIKQILLHNPSAKILCCASTESTSDILLEALMRKFSPREMFRVYTRNRCKDLVNENLISYSKWNEEKQNFDIPDLPSLMSFKIIITTACNSGILYGMGIESTHFTHIILDEVSQMMETEALIPLSMADSSTSIVLAGDDKQIGPFIQSDLVKRHKLNISIMERISKTLDVYKERGDFFGSVQLILNYQCHPKILDFISKQFYNSKLKSAGKNYNMLLWKNLPNKLFPLIFCGVEGEDCKEEKDSLSFYNLFEASTVIAITKDLLADKSLSLSPSSIGIITPYRAQVEKLVTLLSAHKITGVSIGEPEEFQASEKQVIIISTVRCSNVWDIHDKKNNLGLLGQPKRMNTAFSSAESLLIVIGDPYALSRDENWRVFLKYCEDNSSYWGPKLSADYLKERGDKDLKEQRALEDGKMGGKVSPILQPEPIGTVPGYCPSKSSLISTSNNIWKNSPWPHINLGNDKDDHSFFAQSPLKGVGSPSPPSQTTPQIETTSFNPLLSTPMYLQPVNSSYHFNPFIQASIHNTNNPLFHLESNVRTQKASDTSITEWLCIYYFENRELISYQPKHGCPAVTVSEKASMLKIKISLFGLQASLKRKQNIVLIELKQITNKNILFSFGNLNSNTKNTQTQANLLITLPPDILDSRLLEIGKSKNMLLLTVPRLAIPTPLF